MRLIS
jgi:hypothetical protein